MTTTVSPQSTTAPATHWSLLFLVQIYLIGNNGQLIGHNSSYNVRLTIHRPQFRALLCIGMKGSHWNGHHMGNKGRQLLVGKYLSVLGTRIQSSSTRSMVHATLNQVLMTPWCPCHVSYLPPTVLSTRET